MITTAHIWLSTFVLVVSGTVSAPAQTPASTTAASHSILFVCEHGAAKSVIAAAHFNKIARERGLPYRAVARGTAPDADIPVGVRKGLDAAGLELVVQKPVLVEPADAKRASRVVTFEIALPDAVTASTRSVTDWRTVPSVSADFAIASADIKRRVEALIDELAKQQ